MQYYVLAVHSSKLPANIPAKCVACSNASHLRLTSNQESEHQEITLEEDEPSAVKTMLRYLYSSGARDISIRNFNPASAIFVIADKYGLEDLKQRAKTIMLHGAEHPFSSIVEDVDVTSWAHSIGKVWSWTIEGSDDIRQAILKGFFNVPVKRYIENSAMNDLLSSHETFRTKLIVTLAGKHGS